MPNMKGKHDNAMTVNVKRNVKKDTQFWGLLLTIETSFLLLFYCFCSTLSLSTAMFIFIAFLPLVYHINLSYLNFIRFSVSFFIMFRMCNRNHTNNNTKMRLNCRNFDDENKNHCIRGEKRTTNNHNRNNKFLRVKSF